MNMKQNAFAYHFRIPAVGRQLFNNCLITPRPARSTLAQILGANAASAAVSRGQDERRRGGTERSSANVGIGDKNFARRAFDWRAPAQSGIRSHKA